MVCRKFQKFFCVFPVRAPSQIFSDTIIVVHSYVEIFSLVRLGIKVIWYFPTPRAYVQKAQIPEDSAFNYLMTLIPFPLAYCDLIIILLI
jgi:hypothetical protein